MKSRGGSAGARCCAMTAAVVAPANRIASVARPA
jgi:hypothetical protein